MFNLSIFYVILDVDLDGKDLYATIVSFILDADMDIATVALGNAFATPIGVEYFAIKVNNSIISANSNLYISLKIDSIRFV